MATKKKIEAKEEKPIHTMKVLTDADKVEMKEKPKEYETKRDSETDDAGVVTPGPFHRTKIVRNPEAKSAPKRYEVSGGKGSPFVRRKIITEMDKIPLAELRAKPLPHKLRNHFIDTK